MATSPAYYYALERIQSKSKEELKEFVSIVLTLHFVNHGDEFSRLQRDIEYCFHKYDISPLYIPL